MDETGFFKKLISWLHSNMGGILFPNLDIWLCIFTAEKQAARISIDISRTDPWGLSRQPLFIPSWKASLPEHTSRSRWEHCRGWHTWLQQETGATEISLEANSPTSNPAFAAIQQTRKKKNRKTIYATSLQGVTVPTCSYTLLQPGG